MQPRTLELPEDLVALFASPEEAAARAKEALVLELLRQGRISQGKAAHLLGITRWAMLDLMAVHQVPSGPADAEEMRRELEELDRFDRETRPDDRTAAERPSGHAGGQQ
jgi:predicted HTH domain antitoxin